MFGRLIKSFVSPSRSDFIRRLKAKRLECAKNCLLANIATQEEAAYNLRKFGLEFLEGAVSPEETIANLLVIYNDVDDPRSFIRHSLDTVIQVIEHRITNDNTAVAKLPDFQCFPDYIRYRLNAERRFVGRINDDHGFTNEFFAYAISESRVSFSK